ncbi:MAG: hypothetical protein ACQERR_01095 [Pseudomonadota bacterium]
MNTTTLRNAVLAILLGIAIGAGYILLDQRAPDPEARADVAVTDCRPTPGPCAAEVHGGRVRLSMAENIRELDQFPLEVAVDGFTGVERVVVRFDMAGMDMGLNRYRLESDDRGNWRGEAMLPVCTADRVDWWATVAVEHAGGVTRAAFLFHTTE